MADRYRVTYRHAAADRYADAIPFTDHDVYADNHVYAYTNGDVNQYTNPNADAGLFKIYIYNRFLPTALERQYTAPRSDNNKQRQRTKC
jgi:hypothetical protein